MSLRRRRIRRIWIRWGCCTFFGKKTLLRDNGLRADDENRPAHELDLKIVDSPLLKRLGVKKDEDEGAGIKAGDWVRRVKQNQDMAVEGGRKEREVLGGVKVRYYD